MNGIVLPPNQLGAYSIALNPADRELDMNNFDIINCPNIGGGGGVATINGTPGEISVTTVDNIATLSLIASNVTPGSYTNANVTVDVDGRITSASNGTIGITSIAGAPGDITVNTVGNVATLSLTNTSVTPGAYTNTNLTVDADGRITSATSGISGIVSIAGTPGEVTVNTVGNVATVSLTNTSVVPGSYNLANVTVDADGRITSAASGSVAVPTLSAVLTAGNTANADINMNGYDVSSVNDITMSGVLPTITATNIAANLTITSAASLNMGTAGQMTLASGGVLSLGGATYTTVENLNINNSAITKQGAVSDITFDDLTSINTTSTTTPLQIGCGTSINLQPNEYQIGLQVKGVTNVGNSSVGLNVNNIQTDVQSATGISIGGIDVTDSSAFGNAVGVEIIGVSTQNTTATGISIDSITSQTGGVYGLNINSVNSPDTAPVTGINVKSVQSTTGIASLITSDQVISSGTVNGINMVNLKSSADTTTGISMGSIASEVGNATGITIGGIQSGSAATVTTAFECLNLTASNGDAQGLFLQGTIASNGNSYGILANGIQASNEAFGLAVDTIASTAGVCQGIVVSGITAPSGAGNGINVNFVNPRAKANGIIIDNVTSSTDDAVAVRIGGTITGATPGQTYGIFQDGTAQNVFSGATTIGTNSTATQIALTLGGSSVDKVQSFTGAGTVALNGGNIISAAGSSPYTLQLPSNPLPGTKFTICKSVNATVTLNGNGSSINGATTFAISGAQYLLCTVVFINSTVDWIATL